MEPSQDRDQADGSPPAPTPLPEGERLLQLEAEARREGSGLEASSLIGTWRLQRTWPRGSPRPAALASGLLRGLQARLAIGPDQGVGVLALRNSVRLGALELSFQGQARLEGARPLLVFRFERVRLDLAGLGLLDRALPQPLAMAQQRVAALPFFALIAGGRHQGWLAARGRGGGLALWTLEPRPSPPGPEPTDTRRTGTNPAIDGSRDDSGHERA
jgi:hypothetical protein